MLGRASRDHYAVLGVPRHASQEAIKKAFRRLAAEHHPDVSPDPAAAERFREIVEAYEVLSRPEARARYDRLGFPRRPPQPRKRRERSAPAPAHDPLDDVFELGARPQPGERGADVVVELLLDRREARRGTTRGVRYVAWSSCRDCDGRGAPEGSRWRTCTQCRGTGRVREQGRAASGRLLRLRACGRCAGLGRLVDDPCASCRGFGRIEEERALLVRIPPGSRDGRELPLEGQGHAGGVGGRPGDVILRLHVAEAPGRGLRARLAGR